MMLRDRPRLLRTSMPRLLCALASGVMCCMPCQFASAQSVAPYPNKPIRVVIAQLAGGTADTVLRMYAEKMGEILGQRLIVDNRAGSGVASVTARWRQLIEKLGITPS